MSGRRGLFLQGFLGILLVAAVLSGSVCYTLSSLASRFALIAAFLALLAVLIWISVHKSASSPYVTFTILFATSLLFLLWRSNFVSPYYVEKTVNSEAFASAWSYGESGFVNFGSAHSYFFLLPMVIHFLTEVSGISPSLAVYILLGIYATIAALVSMLILRLVQKRLKNYLKNSAAAILPPIIAFLSVSFAYSERWHLALLLTIFLTWLIFNEGLKSRPKSIAALLLVAGITLGSPTGALYLIIFFLIFSIFTETKTKILYALIPISYMILSATSYVVTLKGYASFAWDGFVDFFNKAVAGQFPSRAIPWQRTTTPTTGDVYVTSTAYLALILLSITIAAISTFTRERSKERIENNYQKPPLRANLSCLWLTLGIAAVAYLGSTTRPETTFSDIRTIVIVFVTLPLLFMFTQEKLIRKISLNKLLLTFLIVLMILASLRTLYEMYPKSIYDPINVVEDDRLESISKYTVGTFLNDFFSGQYVVLDYKTYLATYPYNFKGNYTADQLGNSTLSSANIIVFDANGLTFGSLYIPQEAYSELYNLALTQDLIYNSGNISVIHRK